MMNENRLPRGARPFLLGHPEATPLLWFLMEHVDDDSLTAPELWTGLRYDTQYNINRDIQQLMWHAIIEKDLVKSYGGTVRWKVVFTYREGLKQFLEEMQVMI